MGGSFMRTRRAGVIGEGVRKRRRSFRFGPGKGMEDAVQGEFIQDLVFGKTLWDSIWMGRKKRKERNSKKGITLAVRLRQWSMRGGNERSKLSSFLWCAVCFAVAAK